MGILPVPGGVVRYAITLVGSAVMAFERGKFLEGRSVQGPAGRPSYGGSAGVRNVECEP